jgi:hypothetical protein
VSSRSHSRRCACVDQIAHLPRFRPELNDFSGYTNEPFSFGTTMRRSPHAEMALHSLCIFSNADLLQLRGEAIAVARYPHRKIGCFHQWLRSELGGPRRRSARRFQNVRKITMEVKQGRRLSVPS